MTEKTEASKSSEPITKERLRELAYDNNLDCGCQSDKDELVAEVEQLQNGIWDVVGLIDSEMRVPSAEAWVGRLRECGNRLRSLVNDE